MKRTKLWHTVDDDSLEKLGDLSNFLHTQFLQDGADRAWSEKYLNWKLGEENPAGKGNFSYAVSDGRIVGTATLTKKRALYNGKEIVAGEVGDTYTLPNIVRNGKPEELSDLEPDPKSYVNKSVFGRLISNIVHKSSLDDVSLIYGTPNNQSLPGYVKRLGFLNHKRYQNTTNYRPFVKLLIEKYQALKPISKILRLLENLVSFLQRLPYVFLYRGRFQSSVGCPKVKEVDSLWDLVRPEAGFSLIRDYKYWDYRYVQHPLATYKFINIREKDQLVALVVIREFTYRKGRRVAAIVEWMAKEEVSLGYVLSEALRSIDKSKVDYCYYYSSRKESRSLSTNWNLFLRKQESPVIFEKNTLSKSIYDSNLPFEFHLGSSDAV